MSCIICLFIIKWSETAVMETSDHVLALWTPIWFFTMPSVASCLHVAPFFGNLYPRIRVILYKSLRPEPWDCSFLQLMILTNYRALGSQCDKYNRHRYLTRQMHGKKMLFLDLWQNVVCCDRSHPWLRDGYSLKENMEVSLSGIEGGKWWQWFMSSARHQYPWLHRPIIILHNMRSGYGSNSVT